MFGISNSSTWLSCEKIAKGWSSDEKYIIETNNGQKLLLRISDISDYEGKKKEFEIVQKYSKLGFAMSSPVDFGICNEGKSCYMLLTYVEGKDLEEALPILTEKEQYLLGREAGKILRKIHSIPIDESDIPKETKQKKKLWQLSKYEDSPNLRVENDETAIEFVKNNIDLIWKEQPVYQHGDFHPGNLIYMNDGKVGVIDFNRWEVGDPYEEFYKLESFGIEVSIPYSIGQIDAYFDDEIPTDFWGALTVYCAWSALFSIKWAEKFGQADIDGMVERCHRAFKNYDNFNLIVPKWYDADLKRKYI
jgi:aminoglycoside phosphotransferase (APT) family kinase protein